MKDPGNSIYGLFHQRSILDVARVQVAEAAGQ